MLSVTVSIGAAECGADHAEPWSVLKAADQALYGAKHAGRNRVNLAGV
jgi:diguanylate cyclase (GGDEF)-like protein